MLKIGEKLPDFELPDENDKLVSIADFYKGHYLVLYFYPMDFTPGCTKEACTFRDNHEHFKKSGVNVVGISSDSTGRHKRFKEQLNLPFKLLSDTNKKVRKLLGLSGILFGMIPQRITFVISPEGEVIHRFDKLLQYTAHANEAIRVIEEHQAKTRAK